MGVLCKVLFCFAELCVFSSFVIIALQKRELVALLLLFSECQFPVTVPCLFLMVLWVDLYCVIVAFPAHTHLLFGISKITQ